MHSTLNFLACNVDWHIGLSFILFCLSFVQLAKGRERKKKKVNSIAYLSSVEAWPFLVVFLFLSFFLFFFFYPFRTYKNVSVWDSTTYHYSTLLSLTLCLTRSKQTGQ